MPSTTPSMEALIALLRVELRIEDPLGPDTVLLSSGMIDSVSVIILLDAIEDEFGVVLDPEALGVDTFDTPADMLSAIQSPSSSIP